MNIWQHVKALLLLPFWLVIFVVLNLIYIPFLEEPGLEKRFGEDYTQYKQNVPRWIPRVRPWEGSPPERRR